MGSIKEIVAVSLHENDFEIANALLFVSDADNNKTLGLSGKELALLEHIVLRWGIIFLVIQVTEYPQKKIWKAILGLQYENRSILIRPTGHNVPVAFFVHSELNDVMEIRADYPGGSVRDI